MATKFLKLLAWFMDRDIPVSTECIKLSFPMFTFERVYLAAAIFRFQFSKFFVATLPWTKKNPVDRIRARIRQAYYDKKKEKRTWDYVHRIHNNYYAFSFA